MQFTGVSILVDLDENQGKDTKLRQNNALKMRKWPKNDIKIAL